MEETTPESETQDTKPVASEDQKPNSVSYDSHRKLLGEKKAIQAELSTLREADKVREQDKLQKDGKQDEVISALRKEIDDANSKFKTTTERVAFDKFENQCVDVAKELGCTDTESLMMYMSKDKMASIQIDDRLNANKEDLARVVNELKEKKPNLFAGTTINHTALNLQGFKKTEPKTVGEMTKEEIIAQLKNL